MFEEVISGSKLLIPVLFEEVISGGKLVIPVLLRKSYLGVS